jgi:V-type H+-transporting ATPase subunit d
MIDNIILLITGTLHQRPISELISKCHPLGSFEQMEAIHIANTPAELYNAVLVDTPLGTVTHLSHSSPHLFCAAPYFVDCINEQDLDDVNVEIIRNTLFKAYFEDFYEFCQQLGGTTAEVMQEILAVSRLAQFGTHVRACSVRGRSSQHHHHGEQLRHRTVQGEAHS